MRTEEGVELKAEEMKRDAVTADALTTRSAAGKLLNYVVKKVRGISKKEDISIRKRGKDGEI